ncbi:tRNA1(Val) (adenine(37)-N6)-methyltransferase [Hirschia litorea]|uniref:tRNA1(Val) (Adenine(37)-N6)-methyltransferase n=1 Tax=Hirschia litorea TaxID=1199156 RepID=A0ABW2IIS3_9PROT
MTDPEIKEEITKDWLLGEKVSLRQYAKGYRAGLDAVLLAASLETKPGQSVLEAGCGAGAAMMCAAQRLGDISLTGIERDPRMLALAEQNVAENGVSHRVQVRAGDVSDRLDSLLNGFDQVYANPPFFDPKAIQAVGAGKEGAYLADVPLEAWLKFMLHCVKPRGRITMIHRAAALADILSFLQPRFGEISVLPVRAYAGAPAKRVLVRARKGLRKGDTVLYDGLTLYDGAERQLTQRADAIMRGGALEWK